MYKEMKVSAEKLVKTAMDEKCCDFKIGKFRGMCQFLLKCQWEAWEFREEKTKQNKNCRISVGSTYTHEK